LGFSMMVNPMPYFCSLGRGPVEHRTGKPYTGKACSPTADCGGQRPCHERGYQWSRSGDRRRRADTSKPIFGYYKLSTAGDLDTCGLEVRYDDFGKGGAEVSRDLSKKGQWPRDGWKGDQIQQEQRSMMAALGLAKLLQGDKRKVEGGSANLNFRNIWNAVVTGTFQGSKSEWLQRPNSKQSASGVLSSTRTLNRTKP